MYPSLEAEAGEADETSPQEAKRELVRQWRQVAVRGAAGVKFREEVTENYGFRCLFSGQRLPRTSATNSAGVDAAHILPWSTHNINVVPNGLCLNKQCHWAFDEGLFRLSYDGRQSVYLISIPNPVRLAARTAHFDLGSFDALVGPVPLNRLPANEALWPFPEYLDEWNRFLDEEAS